MNVAAFEAQRGDDWRALEGLLAEARGRPERVGSERVRELGELYRATAADLAFARRRFGTDPVTGRLEGLVKRARACVYAHQAHRWSVREFVTRGYWRRVMERPAPLLAGLGFLLIPLALGAVWGATDPGAAIGIVPDQFQAATEPADGRSELSADEEAAFSAEVFTNNIRVAILAFALGITLGIGTAALVMYNGLFIGVIVGIATDAGQRTELITLISAHGVLELSCIAVAAAAGLRIGWALVDPGRLKRSRALAIEARNSLEILLGTAAWLVVAGIVEGYVSGSADTAAAVAVGLGLGALYWTLVLVLGGRRPLRAEP